MYIESRVLVSTGKTKPTKNFSTWLLLQAGRKCHKEVFMTTLHKLKGRGFLVQIISLQKLWPMATNGNKQGNVITNQEGKAHTD